MLSQHEVVPYLISRDLIRARCVVDGNVAVLDSSRRNRNYRIISPDGCYLVKQAVGSDRIETLTREATVYQQLSQGRKKGIASHLPRFYAYDPELHILVLELIQEAENLREQQQRLGRVSSHSAKQAAAALALLHCVISVPQEAAATLRTSVLNLHEPGFAIYRLISGAGLRLIEIIRKQKSLAENLDRLREDWQSSGFIHGDIRAENFLIPVPVVRNTRPIKIVDFEFAGIGDAAWDVGSVFAEYLGFWLFSFPQMTATRLDRFIHLAACPLDNIQPSIRSFWVAYAACMALAGSKRDRFLLRAVNFAALRLIVSAFEMSVSLSSPNAYIFALVQVGMNVLAQPEKAAVELFGIAALP